MNQKTIEKITPPPPGTKKPGIVTFDDGVIAKYWPSSQFGANLEAGVTATAVLETKEGMYGDETMLKQWGDARPSGVRGPGGGGGGGRQMSPEERRSIAIQCCMKAAAELHHGSGDLPGMCKTIKALMVLHDGLLKGQG